MPYTHRYFTIEKRGSCSCSTSTILTIIYNINRRDIIISRSPIKKINTNNTSISINASLKNLSADRINNSNSRSGFVSLTSIGILIEVTTPLVRTAWNDALMELSPVGSSINCRRCGISRSTINNRNNACNLTAANSQSS